VTPPRTLVLILLASGAAITAQAPGPEPLQQTLGDVARNAPDAYAVDAAGMSRSGRRLWSLEPKVPLDGSRRRVVIVGGLDGSPESTAAVVDVLKWYFTLPALAAFREGWQVAAVPCVYADRCGGSASPTGTDALPVPAFPPADGYYNAELDPESRFIWRWVAMQSPDLVIDLRRGDAIAWSANGAGAALMSGTSAPADGSLVAALGAENAAGLGAVPALQLAATPAELAETAASLLSLLPKRDDLASSPMRGSADRRRARAPNEVARLLANRYPAQPSMSYIPALAWSGAMRLADLTGDKALRQKPLADMSPFLSGEKPTIAEPYLLTSLAGHLALSDLGAMDKREDAAALARKAADFILPDQPGEVVRFPRAWTDDMFMATSLWARSGGETRDPRYAQASGRLLTTYAEKLQRPDGLFNHALDGAHAWGRGNGFAAFGMMEALTRLGPDWPDRARVVQANEALMKALRTHQAADGMWRQVVDEPGSYREFTVTAMTVTALARGIRLGWIAASYRPVVERAWQALLMRVAEDGTLLDVCTGTGAGATRQYYLDRAAISGADDRGGAMALVAAVEMAELARPAQPPLASDAGSGTASSGSVTASSTSFARARSLARTSTRAPSIALAWSGWTPRRN
jgi:rhamnogalacturonyl hydrolase YesR